MNIDTETITTMTEANQNFSKVAKVAENNGQAVIFKNNKPKFLLIDVDSNSYFDITDDEKIDVAARRIMNPWPSILILCLVSRELWAIPLRMLSASWMQSRALPTS